MDANSQLPAPGSSRRLVRFSLSKIGGQRTYCLRDSRGSVIDISLRDTLTDKDGKPIDLETLDTGDTGTVLYTTAVGHCAKCAGVLNARLSPGGAAGPLPHCALCGCDRATENSHGKGEREALSDWESEGRTLNGHAFGDLCDECYWRESGSRRDAAILCPSCGATLAPPYRCARCEEAAQATEAERQRQIERIGEEMEASEAERIRREAQLGSGFARIVGQEDVIRRLRSFADLYRSRTQFPGHVLLVGPDGHGKRSIAHAFAEEYGYPSVEGRPSSIRRPVRLSVYTVGGQREYLLMEVRGDHVDILDLSLLGTLTDESGRPVDVDKIPATVDVNKIPAATTLYTTAPSMTGDPSAQGGAVYLGRLRTLTSNLVPADVLTSIRRGDVLLVPNVNRVGGDVRELLAGALGAFRIEVEVGKGPKKRRVPLALNAFTAIGTVSREAECPADLRECFPLVLHLAKYSQIELEQIAEARARASGFFINPSAACLVAQLAKGSPHQVDVLIQRLAVLGKPSVNERDAADVLSTFGFRVASGDAIGVPDDLDQLSGVDFERLVTSLLERMGFRPEMTKASGDGGIDIVAILDRPIIGGKYLVQCKRLAPDTVVGSATVREFYGALVADHAATKGILITTSGFSDQARDFAAQLPLELIDGNALRELLAEYVPGSGTRGRLFST